MREQISHILFKLLTLVIIAPIFAYGLLISLESLEKAWKSGTRTKKWFTLTLALLFLAIALGGLN